MASLRHIVGLAAFLAGMAALSGALSSWPPYRSLAEDQAVIKLSFDHLGAREGACRALTAEEIAATPQHRRKTEECPRGRLPVTVEVVLDDVILFHREARPAGFSRDGTARFYERATVAAGEHRLALRLRDTARPGGFDHERVVAVTLAPAQVLVIGFDQEGGGFSLR